MAEGSGFEFLVAVEVGEGGDEGRACCFRYPAEIFFLAAADGHGAFFDELFEAEIVYAFCGEHDIRAGFKDHVDALHDHTGFSLANLFELLWVVDCDVDAEFHALFL